MPKNLPVHGLQPKHGTQQSQQEGNPSPLLHRHTNSTSRNSESHLWIPIASLWYDSKVSKNFQCKYTMHIVIIWQITEPFCLQKVTQACFSVMRNYILHLNSRSILHHNLIPHSNLIHDPGSLYTELQITSFYTQSELLHWDSTLNYIEIIGIMLSYRLHFTRPSTKLCIGRGAIPLVLIDSGEDSCPAAFLWTLQSVGLPMSDCSYQLLKSLHMIRSQA